MAVIKQRHVGVNLIANHDEVVFITEVGKVLQRGFRPCLTRWIVRVAQHKDLALLVAYGFKVVEIHLVIAVGIAF